VILQNYIKVAFRNLHRNKVFTLINIAGLSFGIAISVIILLLVKNELSYDRYHKNFDRIFRITQHGFFAGNKFNQARTNAAIGNAISKESRSVELSTRVFLGSHKLVSAGSISYSADKFYYCDTTFFSIFSFPFLVGNPATALDDSFTVVLTRDMALRYFNDTNVLGNTIQLDNGWKFRITGVCENVPENSHFHFDFMASSLNIFKPIDEKSWLEDGFATYLLLTDNEKVEEVEHQLNTMVHTYIEPLLDTYFNIKPNQFEHTKLKMRYSLQELGDIHLNTGLEGEYETGFDKMYVFIFLAIAFFILLIACINFMNLTTARSATRAKEVGIRKVTGATRLQLISQFLIESIFISIIALFIALVIIELLLPIYNSMFDKSLQIRYFSNWHVIPIMLVCAVILGILSGSYPAFYLSSIKILNVLHGRVSEGLRNSRLRTILVLFQFTFSIILLISTAIMYRQLKHFQNRDIGFNKDQVIVVSRGYVVHYNFDKFKQVIYQNPRIKLASLTSSLPGRFSESMAITLKGDSVNPINQYYTIQADTDFVDALELKLVSGRNFICTDTMDVLINQTAALEFTQKKLMLNDSITVLSDMDTFSRLHVAGVVNDFNYESLREPVRPLIIFLLHKKGHPQFLIIKTEPGDLANSINFIEAQWKKFTNEPFDYSILNKDIDQLYHKEQLTSKFFLIFSILAIVIASLGLFGLAAFTAEKRTKEIGIRRALGASIQHIIYVLSKEFTFWILIANLIAWPSAYILMLQWLHAFTYTTPIHPLIFIFVTTLTLIITLLTVSIQAMKAATKNPSESLVYE